MNPDDASQQHSHQNVFSKPQINLKVSSKSVVCSRGTFEGSRGNSFQHLRRHASVSSS